MNTELRNKKQKSKVRKIFFKDDKQCSFVENYGKCKKKRQISGL